MKRQIIYRQIISSLISMLVLIIASDSIAKSLTLFEQPTSSSKVIGNLDSNAGIMTIFTPKGGEWIKVADPRNGNVGWIKSADLTNTSVNFNIIRTGNGNAENFEFIQYKNYKSSPPPQLSEATIQEIRLKQQAIQKDMKEMMQYMFKDMHQQWDNFPLLMPVFVVQEKPALPHTKGVTPIAQPNTNKKLGTEINKANTEINKEGIEKP